MRRAPIALLLASSALLGCGDDEPEPAPARTVTISVEVDDVLAEVDPRFLSISTPLRLEPTTYAFIVLPNAAAPACS